MRRLLKDFVCFLIMRRLGRIVRRIVTATFVLVVVMAGILSQRYARFELRRHAQKVCERGGDVLDALQVVHSSRWRYVVRACTRADLAVAGCWDVSDG